jgi:hypothetical protein
MFLLNPRTWFQDWFWLQRGGKVLSLKPQILALQTMIKLLLTSWSHGFSSTWELDSEAYFGCKEDLRFWVAKQKCACCCFFMFDIVGSLWPAKLNWVNFPPWWNLLQDVALIHGLGIKIVIVPGSHVQTDKLLRARGESSTILQASPCRACSLNLLHVHYICQLYNSKGQL